MIYYPCSQLLKSCIYLIVFIVMLCLLLLFVCLPGRSVCLCVFVCVHACMRACMRVCVCVPVRACVRACLCACVRACVFLYDSQTNTMHHVFKPFRALGLRHIVVVDGYQRVRSKLLHSEMTPF